QISNRPFTQASVTPRTQARAAAISNLAARVEKLKSRPQPKQPLYLNSNVDPAAITVARRLLRMGKKIHVVARKVDLPVSDVREFDRAIRAELTMSPVEEFAGARQDEEEISAATPAKVVIERSRNFV